MSLLTSQRTAFKGRTGAAVYVSSPDLNKLPLDAHQPELAAWTMVARVMLNLDEPIVITANGKEVFRGKVNRTIETLAKTLDEYGDAKMTFAAEVTVDVPAK